MIIETLPSHTVLLNVMDYAAFYAGMFLFMLRRSDLALHATNNALKSRGQYFSLNWVTLVIRSMMQSPLLYLWHHYTIAQIAGWFGSSWQPSVSIPDIPAVAALLGYFSYTVMDWVIAKRAPSWVREQIPMLPNGAPPIKFCQPPANAPTQMGTMVPVITKDDSAAK